MDNSYWWYNRQLEEQTRANYSSELYSTAEEATGTNESRGYGDMYGAYPEYRFRKTYYPTQYYYPVRRRPRRRRFRTPAQMKLPAHHQWYHSNSERDRAHPPGRTSARQALAWPQWPIRYSYPTPASLPSKDAYRNNQNSISGELTHEYPNLERRHGQTFLRKLRKPLLKKKVDWEGSTSGDGRSVKTTYSRLSVDVSHEMAAVNRDFETLFALHGATNDMIRRERKQIENEGLRSSGEPKINVAQRSSLNRHETQFHNLEPRHPRTLQECDLSDTLSEKNDSDQLGSNTMWSSMLQDLINRGIIDKLDGSSKAKLEKSLTDMNMVNQRKTKALKKTSLNSTVGNAKNVKVSVKQIENVEEGVQKQSSSPLSGETIVLRDLDDAFRLNRRNNSSRKVESSSASYAKMPNMVERSRSYIPVSTVDANTNWSVKLQELQGTPNECQRCRNISLGAGSGDKAIKSEGNSSNVERKRIEDKFSLRNELIVTPSGDPEVTNWMQNKTGDQSCSSSIKKTNNSSTSLKTVKIESGSSKMTVNCGITGQIVVSSSSSLSSSNETCIDGELLGSAVTKEEYAVTMEDVEEEELPLRCTSETTSISSWEPSMKHFGNTMTSQVFASVRENSKGNAIVQENQDHLGRECSIPKRSKDSDQGSGDNSQVNEDVFKQELKSIVGNMTGDGEMMSDDISNKLEGLQLKVSKNAKQLDTDTCLDIIRKVVEIMRQHDPIINPELTDVAPLQPLLIRRKNHMDHIIKEVNYIEHTDRYLKSPLGEGWANISYPVYFGTMQNLQSNIHGGK